MKMRALRKCMSATMFMVLALARAGEAKSDWAGAPLERDGRDGVQPCDWLEFHAAPGPQGLRIGYRCTTPIDFSHGAAYCVYFDTDGDRSTGFRGGEDTFPLGADYLLQGISLYRYAGDDGAQRGLAWAWSLVGEVPSRVSEDWAEFTLTPEQFSLSSATVLAFLLGDNTASGVGGNKADEMPDGAHRKGGGGKCIWIKTK
jgi:hypothetical protein